MWSNENNILIIDDDIDILEAYQDLLKQEGYHVITISDPTDVTQLIPHNWKGIILCDVLLPHISGLTLLEQFIQLDESLPVIMITGHGDVPMAVEAVKLGATDFLEKPVSPEKLLNLVKIAQEKRTTIIEKRLWQLKELDEYFIGNSSWLNALKQQLQKLASANIPIFIWGEMGTGKTLATEYLHKLNDKRLSPFIITECVENQQIDIEKMIETVKDGTLALKNIHNLPFDIQTYLARLQHNDKRSFRLILISNMSLIELIEKQLIIPELYYLFIYTQIEMLPLAKHATDIPDIFSHYIARACKRLGNKFTPPDKRLLRHIMNKKWGGNIKELINMAELYALDLLPVNIINHTAQLPKKSQSLDDQISIYEKKIIEDALNFHHGKINDVATYLNIPRKKLYLRMRKYELDKRYYKEKNNE